MKAILLSTAFAFVVALGAAHADDKAAEKPAEKPTKVEKAAKAEKKPAAGEVTLSGEMVCGKCALSETKKCQNVLKVTEAGKETKYYLADNATAKDSHSHVCSGSEKATVKGTVAEEAGKKVLTASNIKFASAK